MKHAYLSGNTTLEIQQALNKLVDQFSSSIINGGVGSCFVFQPGGTAGKNVYTDWAALVTAAFSVEGIKTIYFDNTYSTCNIPEGEWDLGGYTIFHGKQPANIGVTRVVFLDKAKIKSVNEFHYIDLYTQSSEPVMLDNSGNSNGFYILANHSTIRNDGTDNRISFFAQASPFVAYWFIKDDCRVLTGDNLAPVFQARAMGSQVFLFGCETSIVQDNVVSRLPNTQAHGLIVDSGAQISVNQITNIMDVTFAERADQENYSPSKPPNWKDPPPITTAEALDRLAAAVVNLGGLP